MEPPNPYDFQFIVEKEKEKEEEEEKVKEEGKKGKISPNVQHVDPPLNTPFCS